MIDWWGLVRNGFWIVGLSILFASYSYIYWWAHNQHIRLREAMNRAEFRVPILGGAALFGIGLFATSRIWWEQIGWGLIIALLMVQTYLFIRQNTNTNELGRE